MGKEGSGRRADEGVVAVDGRHPLEALALSDEERASRRGHEEPRSFHEEGRSRAEVEAAEKAGDLTEKDVDGGDANKIFPEEDGTGGGDGQVLAREEGIDGAPDGTALRDGISVPGPVAGVEASHGLKVLASPPLVVDGVFPEGSGPVAVGGDDVARVVIWLSAAIDEPALSVAEIDA